MSSEPAARLNAALEGRSPRAASADRDAGHSATNTLASWRWLATATLALTLPACGDFLSVQGPPSYANSDLDAAIATAANEVESVLHEVVDEVVIYQAVLSDEYQHIHDGFLQTDRGLVQYGMMPRTLAQSHDAWIRASALAEFAEQDIKLVLGEDEAATSRLTAQVRLSGGLADLYMGLAFCESPDRSGMPVPDRHILRRAVSKLTDAMETAELAGAGDYLMAAQAGRARAHLLLGNHGSARRDAAQVPDGFSYEAIFTGRSPNAVVLLTTKTFGTRAGLMFKWWDSIELSDAPGFMRDPWTGEFDPRIPVHFDGSPGIDGQTPHYSQWKYDDRLDPIPMVHSDAMRLIEAEVAIVLDRDYAGATAILNELRAAVGLAPFDVPSDEETMMDLLVSERFAELFMEGMRMVDLHRFGIAKEVFEEIADLTENDPRFASERGLRPPSGRPTKFPMTDNQAIDDPDIADSPTVRCLPRTG